MTVELTPEEVTEMGKMWGSSYLSTLKVEDVLPYFKPKELLKALSLEEIEAYLNEEKKKPKQ